MNYREHALAYYRQYRAEGHRPDQALRIAQFSAKYDEHSKKRDVLPSRYDAYEGEQRNKLPNGWYYVVKFQYDDTHEAPWDWDDGHGVVIPLRERCSLEDWQLDWTMGDRDGWLYDRDASLAKAIKEGWNAPPYHEPGGAMRAVKADFDYLRRWCKNDWWYVGLIVELYDEDEHLIDENSCWGYESFSTDYLCAEARSWAASMIRNERRSLRAAAHQLRVTNRFHDAMECGL